jgi:chemotaxis response regulator CheB
VGSARRNTRVPYGSRSSPSDCVIDPSLAATHPAPRGVGPIGTDADTGSSDWSRPGGAVAQHDIIVIGASAGGVEALRERVRGLPADLAATVMIVIHVPPESPGLIPPEPSAS